MKNSNNYFRSMIDPLITFLARQVLNKSIPKIFTSRADKENIRSYINYKRGDL